MPNLPTKTFRFLIIASSFAVTATAARGETAKSRFIFKDAQGNPLASGVLEGNAHQLLNQLVGVAIAWGLAIVGTLIILKVVDVTIGLRVSEEEEVQGLDLSQHGEEGYYWEASA